MADPTGRIELMGRTYSDLISSWKRRKANNIVITDDPLKAGRKSVICSAKTTMGITIRSLVLGDLSETAANALKFDLEQP